MQQVDFNGISVNVIPTNDVRQWYMTVEQVAEAYGKAADSILHTIRRHADEIREGLEADRTVCPVRSGNGVEQRREQIILYREGVIKLGFFIRGARAAAFRQFATDLVIDHLQQNNQDSPAGFAEFMDRLEGRLASMDNKLDYLTGMDMTVFGDDAPTIKSLIDKASERFHISAKEVWGLIRKECDVSSYKLQNRRVINFLKNLLGEGIRLVTNPAEAPAEHL